MVWTKLWRCDLENRWCDQNSDGVKQFFKSVINILMVWTKLWRCDLENRWCDQNSDGVKQFFKSVINILVVWTKLWRCDLENRWCEQIFYGVINILMVWSNDISVWTNVHFLEIVWSHRMVWSLHMFFPDVRGRSRFSWVSDSQSLKPSLTALAGVSTAV